MRIKNEKGITLLILVIIVVVLGILATIAIGEVGDLMNQVNKETISTDLLLIQAKAKVLNEKATFNSDESLLKGQKLDEITGNQAVEELISKGVLNTSEEHYDKYYIWDKQTLDELELTIENMEDNDFFIVNYETEEVIYPKGYKHSDGNIYYKLSEITEK